MIQVLTRAFAVLERLAANPEQPQPLQALATAARLHPATCVRILRTLVALGYAEQAAPRQGYALGPRAHVLSASGPYRRDLVAAAEAPAAALAAATGHAVQLAVLRDGDRVLLKSWGLPEGTSQSRALPNPYLSATGRLLVAHASSAERTRVAAKYDSGLRRSWPEVRGTRALARALSGLRDSGHARREAGEVTGIACPILQGGRVVAALGLYLPTPGLRAGELKRLTAALAAAAGRAGEPDACAT